MQFFPLPLLMPFIPVSIGYKQCRNRAIYAGMVIVSFGLLKKVKKKSKHISFLSFPSPLLCSVFYTRL